MAKPIGHLTPEYIAAYMKKLEWLEENPVARLNLTDRDDGNHAPKVSAFHNRLTTRQHR